MFPHSPVSDGLELDAPGQIVSGHSSDWSSTGAKAAKSNVPGMGIGAVVTLGIGRGVGARAEALVGTNVAAVLVLGVGSAGTGVTVEQASAKVPISTARITVSFIRIPL